MPQMTVHLLVLQLEHVAPGQCAGVLIALCRTPVAEDADEQAGDGQTLCSQNVGHITVTGGDGSQSTDDQHQGVEDEHEQDAQTGSHLGVLCKTHEVRQQRACAADPGTDGQTDHGTEGQGGAGLISHQATHAAQTLHADDGGDHTENADDGDADGTQLAPWRSYRRRQLR